MKEVDDTKQNSNLMYSKAGKKIKKGLIDKELTARQLSDMVGTTPQYMNKIIHGVRSGDKYMDKICRILEIQV